MRPRSLEQRWQDRSFAVLDGGMATELERRGCDLNDRLWSARVLVEDPAQVLAVHRAYVAAGVDVLTTASYQATLAGLARFGVDGARAASELRRSVDLAREAAREVDDPPLVAASIGSYGAFLADGSEYRGDYGLSVRELADFHRPRMEILAEGADLLAFETVPSAVEAEAIAEVLRGPGPPAWVAFSSAVAGRAADGTELVDAAAPLRRCARVVAIGVNCSAPAVIEPAISALRAGGTTPILVYPNSGEEWGGRAEGWSGSGIDVGGFRDMAAAWLRAGARVIGGCCRTGPEHVRVLVDLARRR